MHWLLEKIEKKTTWRPRGKHWEMNGIMLPILGKLPTHIVMKPTMIPAFFRLGRYGKGWLAKPMTWKRQFFWCQKLRYASSFECLYGVYVLNMVKASRIFSKTNGCFGFFRLTGSTLEFSRVGKSYILVTVPFAQDASDHQDFLYFL